MLKERHGFAALAAAFALGLILSASQAQAQAFKRTMLQTSPFPPGSPYVTALYVVEINAGAKVPPHTHPGLETLYVLEGELALSVEGQPERQLKTGDSAQVPAGTVHSGAAGSKPVKVLVTYVVEKDKPLSAMVEKK